MKRPWQTRRQQQERPDGEQRWDRAYQSLLQWSQASNQPTAWHPSVQMEPEGRDEGSSLRAGLDPAASADPDDRAAAPPAAGTCSAAGVGVAPGARLPGRRL